MTAELGILMFVYNMTALLIGMLIAFYIINRKDNKEHIY